MWNLKHKQISEYNKKEGRLSDIENKLVVITVEREGEGALKEQGLRNTNCYIYNKVQWYIAQHREYSQCFIVILQVSHVSRVRLCATP